jgi:flagellum-specific ATP synthase
MVDVTDAAHLQAAQRFRQLWSSYEENRDLLLMGAYAPGNDAVLDEAIARREDMFGYVRQSVAERIDFAQSRQSLIEGFGQ